MPRRNRNAHALRIDPDTLADQTGQLAADLGCPTRPGPATGMRLHATVSGTADPVLLRDCLAGWLAGIPGSHLRLADLTAVITDAR